LKENKTKYIILGFLNHEKMSGYDIKQRVDNSISMFWPVGYGQLYPTLKKLEKENLIHHCQSTFEFGPERKLYEITESGRKVLRNWLKDPVLKEEVRYEILLKLFFAGTSQKNDILSNIDEFKKRNQKQLEKLECLNQNLESVLDDHEDHSYFYLTAQFGIKTYKAYIEWADETIQFLEQKKGDGNDG